MKILKSIAFIMTIIFIQSCVKDDFINDFTEPTLRITTSLDTLALNTSFQFEKVYLNNIGQEEIIDVVWSSSDPSTITINNQGVATAVSEGTADILVATNSNDIDINDSASIVVGANTVESDISKNGTIMTTSSYILEGDFVINETSSGVRIDIADNYAASSSLPGLYLYLSNNRNSIRDAKEIGAVQVFNGAHNYNIPNVNINDYSYLVYFCKPFNVKVGEAQL